jgi:hypothetical protein
VARDVETIAAAFALLFCTPESNLELTNPGVSEEMHDSNAAQSPVPQNQISLLDRLIQIVHSFAWVVFGIHLQIGESLTFSRSVLLPVCSRTLSRSKW